jgi:hypothetical protein
MISVVSKDMQMIDPISSPGLVGGVAGTNRILVFAVLRSQVK